LEAIAYVRKRTDLVREVGDWQTLIDMRHADECLLYVSDFIADGGGIGVTTHLPPQLTWDALQARSARTGLLGAAEEWQTWQLQDGREFYVKPSTNDKRWIRPVDAVEENEAVKNCTIPVSCGAFTPSTRVVSRRGGRGWFLFRFRCRSQVPISLSTSK